MVDFDSIITWVYVFLLVPIFLTRICIPGFFFLKAEGFVFKLFKNFVPIVIIRDAIKCMLAINAKNKKMNKENLLICIGGIYIFHLFQPISC